RIGVVRRQRFLSEVDRFPDTVAMAKLTLVQRYGATAVIGDNAASLAHEHALTPGAGHEVIRLDERRDVTVFHHRHRHVIETAAEIVALDGAHASRRLVEQIRE